VLKGTFHWADGESVQEVQTIPEAPAVASPGGAGRWKLRLAELARALRGRGQARRGRRVVLLLAVTCILNGFDLAFTLLVCSLEHFREANPLAEWLIESPPALIAFKVGFVTLGALIILRFRAHLLAEIGCWGVLAFYSILAGMWRAYYFPAG